MKFIGRKKELNELYNLYKVNDRRLVSIIGRRGVGKSRLNDEFRKRCLNNNDVFLFN